MAAKRKKKAAQSFPDISQETLLWQEGSVFVFGVDEAGRGCLAGPVCAAVTCWAPFSLRERGHLPVAVRDSKKMSEEAREECFEPILSLALAQGIGFATCGEIDRWNILRANHLAIARALEKALAQCGEWRRAARVCFLSDGHRPLVSYGRFFVQSKEYAHEFPLAAELFLRGFEELCFVKGDAKVFSIAAASVLAKVSRDRHMKGLAAAHPAYEFERHKGYSTARHVAILRNVGPCSEHRRTFAPVSEALRLFPRA